MTKEEFIDKIKELNINVPDEHFFLEYNKCVYDILEERDTYKAKLNMTNYNTIYRNDKRLILDDNGLDYLLHLEHKIYEFEHPEEQILKADGLLKDLYDLVCERDTYKAKLNMVKDLVMNSDKYSDSDFEGCVFQNDILDIIKGDINDR